MREAHWGRQRTLTPPFVGSNPAAPERNYAGRDVAGASGAAQGALQGRAASRGGTLHAEGRIGEGVTCRVQTAKALVDAGLHPATGGDGTWVCSGDMLLEALVACAGVTLAAVATALGITLRGGTIRADGDLDFRGTLGVAKDASVGFSEIRLHFDIDTDAPQDQVDTLLKLTER